MDNYKQKIFLLCVLLLGCVLTSIGVEHFSSNDETVELPQKLVQETKIGSFNSRLEQKNIVSNDNEIKTKVANSKTGVAKINHNDKKTRLVNLNTATIAELDTLPGIGPAIAQRIVEYRSTQPFAKVEDVMRVKGIGKKKFSKMREMITVE